MKISTDLLLNGELWKMFGITIIKDTPNSWVFFDSEKGSTMFDNIGYLIHRQDGVFSLSTDSGTVHFSVNQIFTRVDAFLFEYFFGEI